MDMTTDQSILRHEVQSVEFGFYSTDEIRALSVKQITTKLAFDPLANAVLGGLYDPALGPIDFNMICPTCHMTQKECPGHMGHIELPVKVYNPVLFATMMNLLKRKCWSCHKFRMAQAKSRVFVVKLELLAKGLVEEAEMLDSTLVELKLSRGDNVRMDEASESTEERQVRQRGILNDMSQLATDTPTLATPVPHATHLRRTQLISAFLNKIKTNTCENCGAQSPGIRQDGHTKVFLKELSAKSVKNNRHRDVTIGDALGNDDHLDEEDSESEDSDNAPQNVTHAKYCPPLEIASQMIRLWSQERELTRLMWGPSADLFFLEVIPVAPSRFRPPVIMGDQQFEHSQNVYLGKILTLRYDGCIYIYWKCIHT